jgi:translocation and assembly module TamB
LSSPKFTASGYTLDKPSLSFAYDKDVFTLKESGGSWNGLPIKASGTIGPLSSGAPTIDMTAQLVFKPENLKQFVPDLADYKLQGTVNAGVRIKGKLPQPRIDLLASSPALSAFGAVDAKNLEVSTALAGDLTKLDKIDLSFKAASLAAGGVGLRDLSGTLRKDGQQVRLENLSASSGEGSLKGGGTVVLGAGQDATLNLAFEFQRLDLGLLARTGGLGVPLTGVLSGKAGVTGPSSNPAISFTGQAPSVSVEGATLTGLVANLSGNTQTIRIDEFRANLGGAPLSAKGTVSLADPFGADIDVSGDGLDLAALTEGMPDLKGQVTGKADLRFDVKSTGKGVSGTGSLRSAAVTAFGVKTNNVLFPLSLEWASGGGSFKSAGGTLDLYGGKVSNNLTFDLKSLKFSDTLKASGVDVNALAQDAAGGLSGKITGKGNLSLKIDGGMANKFSFSGSGQFDMGEGSITGFSGLNLLSALYGVEGIRYAKVTAPLRLEMDRLVVGKGASAIPPANDPVYKSAKLVEDGKVTFDKKLDITADVNVNFQLVNALLGGTAGGVEALLKGGNLSNVFSGQSLESVLKGAISSGREQGKDADFRDVTAKVAGTFEKPSVSLVKVGPSSRQDKPAAPSPAVSSEEPARPEDILKEKIIDAIIPTKKPDAEQSQNVREPQSQGSRQEEQAPNPPAKPIEKQIEEQVGEEIQNQLRKGLDNLFKKR